MKSAETQQTSDRWQHVLSQSLPWHSARLRLRESNLMDAKFMHQMLTNQDVMQFLGGTFELSENDVRESILSRSGMMDSLYIVETVSKCIPVGYAGILENKSIGENEIDFLIAFLPVYQGNGYGNEVLKLLRNQWITQLHRSHCTASVQSVNEKALKILTQCYFRKTGEYVDRYNYKRHIYRYDIDAATLQT